MKKKQIHIAPGMLFHAKICIRGCDYYACLFLSKLVEQDYLVLHKMQLRMPNIRVVLLLYKVFYKLR